MALRSLLEELQRQQQRAQDTLERAESLAQGLDQVVREELRVTFTEEFQMLGDASARAAQALWAVRRAASVRIALWAGAVAAACSVLPAAIVWTLLPSRVEIARLRREREALTASIARLQSDGGKIDLRECGSSGRLCVRVERSGPAYGAHADYLIVKGY